MDLRWKLLVLQGMGQNHICRALYASCPQIASGDPKMTPKFAPFVSAGRGTNSSIHMRQAANSAKGGNFEMAM